MARTIVQLRDEQLAELREVAAREGVSIAELVRQGVDEVLAVRRRRHGYERLLSVAGRFSSGLPDLAERHDDYLAEIYAETADSDPC